MSQMQPDETRDKPRDDPEKMERTEPPPAARHSNGGDGHVDMEQVRMRFAELQSEFIDEPRSATKKAETLMEETVDKVTRSMRDQMERVHTDMSGDADTEKLRLAMHSFKEMIETMPGT